MDVIVYAGPQSQRSLGSIFATATPAASLTLAAASLAAASLAASCTHGSHLLVLKEIVLVY